METIQYHIQGIKVTVEQLSKGRFWWFFLPGIVITLVYFAALYWTYSTYEQYQFSSENSWIDTFLGWINYGTSLLYSLVEYILEKIYIFIVLTLLSPFNAFLAERFDKQLTGTHFPYSIGHFIRDFFRMLLVVSVALFLELWCMLLWWILSFIPGLSLLDDIVYFSISAFFFGFAFFDYALERYRLSIGKSLKFAFQHPLSMLLTGSIFLIIYAIPYIGIPTSTVLTTMISTVVYLYLTKKLTKEKTSTSTSTTNTSL